jgi:hypothetical protein
VNRDGSRCWRGNATQPLSATKERKEEKEEEEKKKKEKDCEGGG